jgi:hypothetical protein
MRLSARTLQIPVLSTVSQVQISQNDVIICSMSKTIAFFVILFLACVAKVDGQGASGCSDQNVNYRIPTKDLQKKILFTTLANQSEFPVSAKHSMSPQGTRWFVELDPDYMSTQVSWTTTLYIKGGSDGRRVWKASFIDHGDTFSARWINEKLLFVQVWWGRMASTDLIFDVNQGTIIYNEFAHYGELFETCQ